MLVAVKVKKNRENFTEPNVFSPLSPLLTKYNSEHYLSSKTCLAKEWHSAKLYFSSFFIRRSPLTRLLAALLDYAKPVSSVTLWREKGSKLNERGVKEKEVEKEEAQCCSSWLALCYMQNVLLLINY